MINILVVEDQPKFIVEDALNYLKAKNLNFEITLCLSAVSSMRYLRKNLAEIDLAIVDLGIPFFEGEFVKSSTEGFDVVQEIERLVKRRKKDKLPIIINSTTKIEFSDGTTEEDYFASSKERGLIIEHVDCLEGAYLYEFIEKNMPEKVEFH